jgi:hypothetical protein
VDSPEKHMAQEGPLVVWTDTSGETSSGCCKLDETKGSVIVLGRHGKMEMLVTWKHVMKSLLMENVFKLCRV